MAGSQLGDLFSGIWGDPGQAFVDSQGGQAAVFGKKPQVAPFVPVDLSAETQKATAADLANYGNITDLLNQIIPGFTDMLSQGTANTNAELSGQLPPDLAAQVQRSSAYQALQGGYSGTGMAYADAARNYGLTSLQLTQMGNNSAQLWSNLAEAAYSPFTVSTGQQAGTTAANNAGTQANLQYKYNVAAAPDPGALGVFNVDAALGQQALSFGFGAAGGAIGGGGGGGTAQAPTGGYPNYNAVPGYTYNPSTGQYSNPSGYSGPPGNNWMTNATWSSDRRLKQEIVLVDTAPSGLGVYAFSYLHPEGTASLRYIGAMADEVLKLKPEAVTEDENGYLSVNYSMIDVPFAICSE